MDVLHFLTDARSMLTGAGLVGLAAVIFTETGLLIGFFLPGDSLLFTAGMLSAGEHPVAPLWAILLIVPVAAFLGDQTGFLIGRHAGPVVLDSRIGRRIGPAAVQRADSFFARRGTAAVFLARFVPVLRTLVPVTAGVSGMDHRRFTAVNAVGALCWGLLVPVAGHLLGGVALIRDHIDLILPGIVVLSVLPALVPVLRSRLSGRVTGTVRTAVSLAVAGAAEFGVLTTVVAAGMTDSADHLAVVWVADHRASVLTPVMEALSTVFAPAGAALIALLIAVLAAAVTRGVRAPALVLGVPAAAMALCYAVKIPLDRARPEAALQLMRETDGSFPSGHVTGATALLAITAVLVVLHVQSVTVRNVTVVVAAVLVAGVAVSRVYVGDHYPTDVVGGLLAAGTVWVASMPWWRPREVTAPGRMPAATLDPAEAQGSATTVER